MKYIIMPIFRFLWFLIGGFIWCIAWMIYFIWDFKPMDTKDNPFSKSLYGWSDEEYWYRTPWDYLIRKSS